MRLLRNYQIHVGAHPITKREVEVLFAGETARMTVEVIDNLEASAFMQLDAIVKHSNYDLQDIVRMINLFASQQERLGVYELLRRGVERLIEEVCNVV